jgi:FAD/FMN-containing dehydrogenase
MPWWISTTHWISSATLLVGSEGTLGFISAVTYDTVIDHPNKASALIVFPDVETCCNAVTVLKTQPVSAVELLDRRSMRSVQDKPGMPLSYNNCRKCLRAIDRIPRRLVHIAA